MEIQACERKKTHGNRKISWAPGVLTESVTGKGIFLQLYEDKGIQAPETNRNAYQVPKYLFEDG